MLTITPLLADLIDVLKAIVPLALLVIWVLSQVFGQKGPQPGQGKAPAAGGAGNGGQAQGGLRQEIDRFLREAREEAERQQGQQGQGQGQQGQGQRGQPAQADPLLTEKKRQQKQEKQKRKQEQQREAVRQRGRELSAGGQSRPTRPEREVQVIAPPQSVSQQVSSYMDTSSMAQSAARLGAEIGQTDERLAAHLHQTFDHDLGQLGGSQTTEVDRGGASVVHSVVGGAQLAAQLANPHGFRNAVIMNEILTRPEHRWD